MLPSAQKDKTILRFLKCSRSTVETIQFTHNGYGYKLMTAFQ